VRKKDQCLRYNTLQVRGDGKESSARGASEPTKVATEVKALIATVGPACKRDGEHGRLLLQLLQILTSGVASSLKLLQSPWQCQWPGTDGGGSMHPDMKLVIGQQISGSQ